MALLRMTPKRNLVLLTVLTVLSTFLAFFARDITSVKEKIQSVRHLKTDSVLEEQEVHYVIIQCKGNDSSSQQERENWDHQLRQIKVLLKSAAFLATRRINIHLVTDSDDVYNQIIAIPESWPLKYRRQLLFSPRREVIYPKELAHIRNLFCRCATAMLFLPDILHDLDSVIFVDTDTLFMQPPEQLWNYFQNFDNRQMAGVTPCLYLYNEEKKIPHFGSSGLNSGVLLFNLTRIRRFPKGWVHTISEILKKHRNVITLGDQDILNVMFSGQSEVLAYEVECHWNYRVQICSKMRNKCPSASVNGVALLHGCATTFVNDKAPKMKAVFEAWEKFDLGWTRNQLVSLMQKQLHKVTSKMGCTRLSNIDDILLKGLRRHLAGEAELNE